jgi:hypothetical protein
MPESADLTPEMPLSNRPGALACKAQDPEGACKVVPDLRSTGLTRIPPQNRGSLFGGLRIEPNAWRAAGELG